MTLLIILMVFAVLLLVGSVTAIAVTQRRRGVELEPPLPPSVQAPSEATPTPTASSPPTAHREAPATGGESPPGAISLTQFERAGRVEAPGPDEEAEAAEPKEPQGPEANVVPAPQAPALETGPPEVGPSEVSEVAARPRPRFRDRLGKARSLLAGYVGSILSRSGIDDETWDELEEALIRADVGVTTTSVLLDDLRQQVKAEGIRSSESLLDALKDDLKKQLTQADRSLRFEPGSPNVWLFVGVNGVGKTTTIGKVALREAAAGKRVVMAAGDTFRAAAGEQLELWAKRVGADIVRGAEGADPGAVVFDAVQRAAARDAQLVLADTAGRLHTKVNLMEELRKVRRVAEREPGQVSEVLLVIDATTGQNGLVQAKQFADAVEVTGVVLTKLDGTAKGGIALAIQSDLKIPIKLVGLGEKPEDLVTFDPDEFVEALFS